jgi:hypothetical protein
VECPKFVPALAFAHQGVEERLARQGVIDIYVWLPSPLLLIIVQRVLTAWLNCTPRPLFFCTQHALLLLQPWFAHAAGELDRAVAVLPPTNHGVRYTVARR